MDRIIEPKILGVFALAFFCGVYFLGSGGKEHALDPLHLLEFAVLIVALYIAQENYHKLFSSLGTLANNGKRLRATRATYRLRLHYLLGLLPMGLAVLFLTLSSALYDAHALRMSNSMEFVSVLYLGSLFLLYLVYCFTNATTLRLLSDVLANGNGNMNDESFSSQFMIFAGNNILFLKSENAPAAFAYFILILFAIIMIVFFNGPYSVEEFLGGAATVHLAISAIRFRGIVNDTTLRAEAKRDAIEILAEHMRVIVERLPILGGTLATLSGSRAFYRMLFLSVLLVLIVVSLFVTEIREWLQGVGADVWHHMISDVVPR